MNSLGSDIDSSVWSVTMAESVSEDLISSDSSSLSDSLTAYVSNVY